MDGGGNRDSAEDFLLELIILQIYTLKTTKKDQEQQTDEIANIKYKCTTMNLRWEQVNLNFYYILLYSTSKSKGQITEC